MICLSFGKENYAEWRANHQGLPELTPNRVDQLIFLARCKYFADLGQGVDPMTIRGAERIFGGRAQMAEAIRLQAPVPNPKGRDDYDIKWPVAWGDDGWPTGAWARAKTPVIGDTRGWSCMERSNLVGRKKLMGCVSNFTPHQFNRTIEGARIACKKYYKEYNCRPGGKGNPDTFPDGTSVSAWKGWLRTQRTSLAKICNEVGIPGRQFGLSYEDVQKAVKEHYEKTGKRLSKRDKVGAWLNARCSQFNPPTTLSEVNDQLGIPRKRILTDDLVWDAIRNYGGTSPSSDLHWTSRHLRAKGLTISGAMRKINPNWARTSRWGTACTPWTLERCRHEVEKFVQKWNCKPTSNCGSMWAAMASWLRATGSGLPLLIQSMYPRHQLLSRKETAIQEEKLKRYNRLKEEVKSFKGKAGEYPTVKGTFWRNADAFLRINFRIGLHDFCRQP
jgi:hypothetical protein